jgi:integrase
MKKAKGKERGDGIYKRKDRAGFWFAYTDWQGKRVQMRTLVPTLTQARDIRRAKLVETDQIRNGVIPKPSSPEEEKRKALTFSEVGDRYLAFQKARLTVAAYSRTVGIVKSHLTAAFGSKRLAEITREDCDAYVTARTGLVSPASITKELNILKHFLGLCVDWKLVAVNVAHRVKAPKVNNQKSRHLQPEEIRRLLAACPVWLRPIAGLLVTTGMRRSECLGLRWAWIDRNANCITIPRTKNGKVGIVRLNALAWSVLDSLPRSSPEVFPEVKDARKRIVNSPQNVSVCFKRVCREAKIEDFRLHDLRHTFASRLVNDGVPLQDVSTLLRHSDLRMTQRYAHLEPGRLQSSVERLDAIMGDILPLNSGSVPVALEPINLSKPMLTAAS